MSIVGVGLSAPVAVDGVDIVYKWYLPTLSEIIALREPGQEGTPNASPGQQRVRAEREWSGAIAAVNQILQQQLADQPLADQLADQTDESCHDSIQGVVLSGPSPVLSQFHRCDQLSAWTFTPAIVGSEAWMPLQLLPATDSPSVADCSNVPTLSLLPADPLASEQFCLVLTTKFSLVMALGETSEAEAVFQFSFSPEVVQQAWQALRSRLVISRSPITAQLNQLVGQFAPIEPNYRTVTQFSRLMLANLPEPCEWDIRREAQLPLREAVVPATAAQSFDSAAEDDPSAAVWHPAIARVKTQRLQALNRHNTDRFDPLAQVKPGSDTELLQAIVHEVRTPLTTIRTLTRLLLKRKDLNPDVIKRLETIDRECTEQINRFNLFFRAVELETSAIKRPLSSLSPISLTQVFQQNVPRWQQQASQRNLTLDVILPQTLPMVVADPTMLDQVLTGLIDRITHSLPPNSHIQLRVSLAGHQLKLQFQSQPPLTDGLAKKDGKSSFTPTLKSLGQLLMFQPETGNLSLNLAVTKNLFQALGGKLIVRQKPQQGEVLTIFLPLETRAVEV